MIDNEEIVEGLKSMCEDDPKIEIVHRETLEDGVDFVRFCWDDCEHSIAIVYEDGTVIAPRAWDSASDATKDDLKYLDWPDGVIFFDGLPRLFVI